MSPTLSQIRFRVPVDGVAVLVTAERGLMSDKGEGLHSFVLEDPCEQLEAGVGLLNRMIDTGMPWSLFVDCCRGPGLMGALIEAAHNRHVELKWLEGMNGNAA